MRLLRQQIEETAAIHPLPTKIQPGETVSEKASAHDGVSTTEKVALATAGLKARRDAENAHRETTRPINEAIDQPGLNATDARLRARGQGKR